MRSNIVERDALVVRFAAFGSFTQDSQMARAFW